MSVPIVVTEEFWVLAAGGGMSSPPVFIASKLGAQGQVELTAVTFLALRFKTQGAAEDHLAEFARRPPLGVQPKRYRPMHIRIDILMTDTPADRQV